MIIFLHYLTVRVVYTTTMTTTTTTATAITTILQPLYRTTCISQHPQPRTRAWRILLEQSFTACMPLLMTASTFGLGRRRWVLPALSAYRVHDKITYLILDDVDYNVTPCHLCSRTVSCCLLESLKQFWLCMFLILALSWWELNLVFSLL